MEIIKNKSPLLWILVGIGTLIFLLVFVLFVLPAGYFLFNQFFNPHLSESKVVLGKKFFQKTLFVNHPGIGIITDIATIDSPQKNDGHLIAASPTGAFEFDKDGVLLKDIKFKNSQTNSLKFLRSPAQKVKILRLNRTGEIGFLDRGSWFSNAKLFSSTGEILWEHGAKTGVNDTAVGDLDGDGIPEFFIGFNGNIGAHLLDIKGKMIWEAYDTNVWQVAITDVNGDGKNEIIRSNAQGEIVVLRHDGLVISIKKPEAPVKYFSDFSFCNYPKENDLPIALVAEKNLIIGVDYNGNVIKKLELPDVTNHSAVLGTPLSLNDGKTIFLALLANNKLNNNTMLAVFNEESKLEYQENLPGPCLAIHSFIPKNSLDEKLLVGCNDKIWAYSKPPIPAHSQK